MNLINKYKVNKKSICQYFFKSDEEEIVEITNSGDWHNDQCVVVIKFQSGNKIVYKPTKGKNIEFLKGMLSYFFDSAVCYIMAIQLHMVGDCTVLLLILFLLRSYVGGIHMDSYIICFLCSCIVVFGTLMIRKYCPLEPFKATIISLVEVLMMYCMIPVENENRPVDDAEKQMFRRIINRILLGIALVILGGFIVGFYRYLSIITYTLGIIIISMFLGRLKCSYFNLPKNKKLK